MNRPATSCVDCPVSNRISSTRAKSTAGATTAKWKSAEPLPWEKETDRFFAALKRFDDYLASAEPLHAPAEKLLQAPLADALTHIGQIAMLRRMAGGPVKAENYLVADIVIGRVGPAQTPPKQQFD